MLIGCVFTDLPRENIVLDESASTTLRDEFLLNAEGDLEIHKVFDLSSSKIKESVYAIAMHPAKPKTDDLLLLKNPELKKRMKELKIEDKAVDERSNPSIRSAIWRSERPLALSLKQIPLDKEDCKAIWENIEKWMPLYTLFRS